MQATAPYAAVEGDKGDRMLEQVQLRDGTEAWITALQRGDRERLAAEFAALTEETRRQRFLSPVTRLSEQMLDHLVNDVDGIDHIALVLTAETSEGIFDPVAIARMVRYPDAPDSADLAVTVKDAWQGRGVATTLLAVLVRQRPEGVARVITEVSADNRASLAMLRRLGPLSATSNGHGALDVEILLDAARDDAATPGDDAPSTSTPTSTPSIPLIAPSSGAQPKIDREQRHHLQTRDLLCPWLN